MNDELSSKILQHDLENKEVIQNPCCLILLRPPQTNHTTIDTNTYMNHNLRNMMSYFVVSK